jgi:SAM-dependent methyltransferase
MSPLKRTLASAVAFESWCFDKRHGIDTLTTKKDRRCAMADLSAGFWYLPTRPRTARRVLRDLPIEDYSSYTFIDIGSGKGRMLFLATEHPFQRIEGVEMRKELHERAVYNLRRFQNSNSKCPQVECLNLNALDYTFPEGNLVVYFFNPFGREVMEKVLRRLSASMEQQPRDVVLVMSYPEAASVVDAMPQFQSWQQARNYYIYRNADRT